MISESRKKYFFPICATKNHVGVQKLSYAEGQKCTTLGCIFYYALIHSYSTNSSKGKMGFVQKIFKFHVSPLFAFPIFLYHYSSEANVASNNAENPISAINICLWLRAWNAITNHTIVIILKNDIWSCELQMRLAKKFSRCYFGKLRYYHSTYYVNYLSLLHSWFLQIPKFFESEFTHFISHVSIHHKSKHGYSRKSPHQLILYKLNKQLHAA